MRIWNPRRALKNLILDATKAKEDKRLNDYIEMHTRIWEKAETYTNIVVGLGYVAYFAMWSNAVEFIPVGVSLLSALLMSLSLMCFVLFELAKMILTAITFDTVVDVVNRAITPDDFDKAIEDYRQRQRMVSFLFTSIWRFSLPVTVALGFTGAFILLYGLVAKMLTLFVAYKILA